MAFLSRRGRGNLFPEGVLLGDGLFWRRCFLGDCCFWGRLLDRLLLLGLRGGGLRHRGRDHPGGAVFQGLQPPEQRLGGGVQLGTAQFHEGHFQLGPLIGVPHFVEGLLKGVQPVENGGQTHGKRLAGHQLQLLRGTQHQLGGVLHGFDQHQAPEIVRHLFAQAVHVLGLPVEPVNGFQSVGRILLHNVLGQGGEIIPGGHAGGLVDHLQSHVPVPAQALVQQGQGVPQSAVGDPGDEQGGVLVQLGFLLGGHVLQPLGDVLRGDPPKVEPLAPGQNGGQQLVDFRGGQDEYHMGRRFFQSLQQSVEGGNGEHVHLVDDVHPVLGGGGGEVGLLNQGADAVHAVVAGGVDLHHIQNGALFQSPADFAFPAGVPVLGVEAVHRPGQDFGAGGLACAPGPGEQVSVGNAAPHQLVFQGDGDLGLAYHVREELGPVFSVEHLIHAKDLLSRNFPQRKHRAEAR